MRSSQYMNRGMATPASKVRTNFKTKNSLQNSRIGNFKSPARENPLRESTFSNYTTLTDASGKEKLEIKSNIRSIHAYRKHVSRQISPDS